MKNRKSNILIINFLLFFIFHSAIAQQRVDSIMVYAKSVNALTRKKVCKDVLMSILDTTYLIKDDRICRRIRSVLKDTINNHYDTPYRKCVIDYRVKIVLYMSNGENIPVFFSDAFMDVNDVFYILIKKNRRIVELISEAMIGEI